MSNYPEEIYFAEIIINVNIAEKQQLLSHWIISFLALAVGWILGTISLLPAFGAIIEKGIKLPKKQA